MAQILTAVDNLVEFLKEQGLKISTDVKEGSFELKDGRWIVSMSLTGSPFSVNGDPAATKKGARHNAAAALLSILQVHLSRTKGGKLHLDVNTPIQSLKAKILEVFNDPDRFSAENLEALRSVLSEADKVLRVVD